MVEHREPSLDEILSDPVVLAMMKRDGVERSTVQSLIADIDCRMAHWIDLNWPALIATITAR